MAHASISLLACPSFVAQIHTLQSMVTSIVSPIYLWYDKKGTIVEFLTTDNCQQLSLWKIMLPWLLHRDDVFDSVRNEMTQNQFKTFKNFDYNKIITKYFINNDYYYWMSRWSRSFTTICLYFIKAYTNHFITSNFKNPAGYTSDTPGRVIIIQYVMEQKYITDKVVILWILWYVIIAVCGPIYKSIYTKSFFRSLFTK